MSAFKTKTFFVEAYKLPLPDEPVDDLFIDWCDKEGFKDWNNASDAGIYLQTAEGILHANPGDWIIKNEKGDFTALSPDVFAARFEKA